MISFSSSYGVFFLTCFYLRIPLNLALGFVVVAGLGTPKNFLFAFFFVVAGLVWEREFLFDFDDGVYVDVFLILIEGIFFLCWCGLAVGWDVSSLAARVSPVGSPPHA